MKKGFFIILKMIFMVFMSIIAGGLLLTAVYMIPVDKMKENVANSLQEYNTNPIEAWCKNYPNYTQTDMQTESIKIMEAISDEGGSPFARAMNSVYYRYEDDTVMSSLIKYVSGEDNPGKIYYSRYWHGYLTYLKPLLYFVSLSTIKLINMTLQFVLCIVLAILLRDKLGIMFSFAFCGFVLVLNPVTIFLSMQNDVIFYIASVSSILLLLFNDKMKDGRSSYYYLFLFIGVLVAYLDFLTYPAVSVGVPLLVYILLNKCTLRDYFLDIIRFSTTWVFGYAGMWAGKWYLSDLLLSTNVVNDGVYNLVYRSSGNPYGETAEMNSTFFHTVAKNFAILNVLPLKVFCLVMVSVAIYLFFKNKNKIDFTKVVAVLIVSTYPFFWYFAIRNHSVIHPWIEYRELGLFVFGILCILGLIANRRQVD
ncbi:hypothetical protein [Butyrivibrio sp. JL13D10]|uniref:hypothetical protein n=1 Tax=Butyrivibrio sp. JL13D10 TaxID=3236815 RepID=UPI0038B6032D